MMAATSTDSVQLGEPALAPSATSPDSGFMNDEEQARVLGQDVATLQSWREAAQTREPLSLPREALERTGAVLGIYRTLVELLPTDKARSDWLRAPNAAPMFAGRSALDQMSETDIVVG